MFRAELYGINNTLVVSWQVDKLNELNFTNEIYNCRENNGNSPFSKLSELQQQIIHTVGEFVSCMKNVHDGSNTAIIESELNESEISSIKIEEVEPGGDNNDLTHKMKLLEADNSRLKNEHSFKDEEHKVSLKNLKQDLQSKHNEQMSELRKYFENRCAQLEKQYAEEVFNQHVTMWPSDSSCSEGEFQEMTKNNFESLEKGINKSEFEKYLRNITKAYEEKINNLKEEWEFIKNNEIMQLKNTINEKYTKRIGEMERQIDELAKNVLMEDTVKQLNHSVKREYEEEMQNLQNKLDKKYYDQIEKEKRELKLQLDEEYSKKINEIELNHEEKIRNLEIEKKDLIEQVQREQERLKELEVEKNEETENTLSEMIVESALKKVLLEQELLVNSAIRARKGITVTKEIKEQFDAVLRELQAKYMENIETKLDGYRKRFKQFLNGIQLSNLNVDQIKGIIIDTNDEREAIKKIQDELQDMRNAYVKEITSLEEYVTHLQNIIKTLQNKDQEPSDIHLEQQIQTDQQQYPVELEVIMKERDSLKNINVTLQKVINEFTKYLMNCENELNNTLIGNLAGLRHNEITKFHFAPDVSEIVTLCDESLNVSQMNGDISFFQLELNTCLERLRDEAAAILGLTRGKSLDGVSRSTQTNFESELQAAERVRNILQHEICSLKELNDDADIRIKSLVKENFELKERITVLESVEGYGESLNVPIKNNKGDNMSTLQDKVSAVLSSTDFSSPQLLQIVEELCRECEHITEETKREKDDLQYQFEAADKKLRSLKQFMEEQALDRESERDEYDKNIKMLQETLKDKERDLTNKKKYEIDVSNLETQIKDITRNYEQMEKNNQQLQNELSKHTSKVWKLRETISELETQLASKSEEAEKLRESLVDAESQLERQLSEYNSLLQQMDSLKQGTADQLQSLQEQHEASCTLVGYMKMQLAEIEKSVLKRTKELEDVCVQRSCISSPSEDFSISEHFDRNRLLSPQLQEQFNSPVRISSDLFACLWEKLNKLYRAEDITLKRIKDNEIQLNTLIQDQETQPTSQDDSERSRHATTPQLSLRISQMSDYSLTENSSDNKNELCITPVNDNQFELTNIPLFRKADPFQSPVNHTKHKMRKRRILEERKVNSLNSLNDNEDRTNESLEIEYKNLKEKYESLEKLSSWEKLNHTSLKDKLKEMEILETQLKVIDSELETEKKTHFDTIVKLRKYESDYEQVKKELEKTEEDNESLRNEMVNWICKYEKIEEDNQLDKEQINELRKIISDLKVNLESERKQVEEGKQKIQTLEENMKLENNKNEVIANGLTTERDEALKLCENLKIEIEELKMKMKLTSKETCEIKMMLESRIAELEEDIKRLQESLKSKELDNENLRQKLEQEKFENLRQMDEKGDMRRKSSDILNDGQNDYKVEEELKLSPMTDSVHELTERLQHELEICAQLDQNMLTKVEGNRIDYYSTAPSINLIFNKVFNSGLEILSQDERKVIHESICLNDDERIVGLQESLQEERKQILKLKELLLEEESDKKHFKEKFEDVEKEVTHLQMILGYCEERISYFVAKLDEYGSRLGHAEMSASRERCKATQKEIMYNDELKRNVEMEKEHTKEIQELNHKFLKLAKEHELAKKQLEISLQKIEAVTAELNSIKIIEQYNSDSDCSLTRSYDITKWNDGNRKNDELYGKYEKQLEEYSLLQMRYMQQTNVIGKLKMQLEAVSLQKQKLDTKVIDLTLDIEEEKKLKNKISDRLNVLEMLEIKRRKRRLITEEAKKKELECITQAQNKLELENKLLKTQVMELKEFKENFGFGEKDYENQGSVRKILRAESFRKMLVWQKRYLQFEMMNIDRTGNLKIEALLEILRNHNNCSHVTWNISIDNLTQPPKPLRGRKKFRCAVYGVIVIHRMKYLITRRMNYNFKSIINCFNKIK